MGRWYSPPRVDVTVLCNQGNLLLVLTSNEGCSVYSLLLKRHDAEANSDCPSLSNIQAVHNLNAHTLYVYFSKPLTCMPNVNFPPPPPPSPHNSCWVLAGDRHWPNRSALIDSSEEGNAMFTESKMPLSGCATLLCRYLIWHQLYGTPQFQRY